MSFNQMLVDQPEPEIARSAVILGEVHVGAGAILAQGLVVRAHGAAVSIGNYSAILENGVVIGTREHPHLGDRVPPGDDPGALCYWWGTGSSPGCVVSLSSQRLCMYSPYRG